MSKPRIHAPITVAGIAFAQDAATPATFRGTAANGVALWACKRGRGFSYGIGSGASSRERGQAANIEAALSAAVASLSGRA